MDRNKKIAIVLIVCLTIGLSSTAMFGMLGEDPKDINELGTLTVWTSVDMRAINEGETIVHEEGLRVTLESTWAGEPTATLKVAGTPVENGVSTRLDTMTVWIFTLDSIPAGTNDAYVFFGGMYTPDRDLIGRTYGFKVYSSEEPTYDPPVIDAVADKNVSVGTSVSITWWYTYVGPADVVVTQDGEVIRETRNTLTTGKQPISASKTFDVAGSYDFILTITPDSGTDVSTDSVTVTVEEERSTTTPTTTPTTTTGTATTDEDEPPVSYIPISFIAAAAGAILIIMFVRRRR